jgi:transcriptional regulator of arginine metabolism
MTKKARQGTLLRIVDSQEIATQAELATALSREGFDVVQTTISRDIAELGLVKIRGGNGHLVYARQGTPDRDQMDALAQALRRWAMGFAASGNLVVVDTPNGYADPVAQAFDQAGHPKVLGTIAGENTVLVVAVEGVSGSDLESALSDLSR